MKYCLWSLPMTNFFKLTYFFEVLLFRSLIKYYLQVKLGRETYKVDRKSLMQIQEKYTYAHTHYSCHVCLGYSLIVTISPDRWLKVFGKPIKKKKKKERIKGPSHVRLKDYITQKALQLSVWVFGSQSHMGLVRLTQIGIGHK